MVLPGAAAGTCGQQGRRPWLLVGRVRLGSGSVSRLGRLAGGLQRSVVLGGGCHGEAAFCG